MRAIATLCAVVMLSGCALGHHNKVGLATVNSQGEAAPAPVAAPQPSIVEAVRALVGDWRGVRALVSDVPPDVQPGTRGIAAIPPVAPAPVSREMSPPPEATERGPIVWLNSRGVAFHRDRACRYVEPDAMPVVLGLARQSRRPCRTCGGKVNP